MVVTFTKDQCDYHPVLEGIEEVISEERAGLPYTILYLFRKGYMHEWIILGKIE